MREPVSLADHIAFAFRAWVLLVAFPPVYLIVWATCRAIEWPRPSVMD